jgi:hypothetical protein
LIVHQRPDFQAIVGGVVYRGPEIPGLCGVYLYGDFANETVRGLRTDGTQILAQRDLAKVPSLNSFGYDENYAVYAVSYFDGTLFKVTAP